VGERHVAVADAGPLIHLDEIDAVALFAAFERVLIPDVVAEEVGRHRPRLQLDAGRSSRWVPATRAR